MKTHLVKISAIALFLSVGFVACKKELITDVKNEKENLFLMSTNVQNISYNGHWLNFRSIDDFNQTIERLKQLDESELVAFEKQFQGFNSIRNQISILNENEDIDHYQKIQNGEILYTPDDAFGTLVSSNGFIQIADTIYSFNTTDSSYKVHAQFEKDLLAGTNAKDIIGRESIHTTFSILYKNKTFPGTITPHEPGTGDNPIPPGHVNPPYIPSPYVNICSFQPENHLGFGDHNDYIYNDKDGNPLPKKDGRDVRFEYKLFREYYYFYNCVGTKTEIQNKNKKGNWKTQINADYITLNGCMRGTLNSIICGYYEYEQSYSETKTNKKRLKKTIRDWGGIGCHYNIKIVNSNAHLKAAYQGKEVNKWYIF